MLKSACLRHAEGNERLWRRVGNPNAGRGMNRRHAEERMSAPPPGRNSRRTGLAYYQELRPPLRAPNVQIPGPSPKAQSKRQTIFLLLFCRRPFMANRHLPRREVTAMGLPRAQGLNRCHMSNLPAGREPAIPSLGPETEPAFCIGYIQIIFGHLN